MTLLPRNLVISIDIAQIRVLMITRNRIHGVGQLIWKGGFAFESVIAPVRNGSKVIRLRKKI